MKNKMFLSVFLLFSFNYIIAQDYIGFDNFGCLRLDSNNLFSFHYFDCGIDSGRYERRGDTIILNSLIPLIQIYPTDCIGNDSILDENLIYFCPLHVYDSENEIVDTIKVWIDTLNNSKLYMNSANIKKGQLVELYLLKKEIFRIFWPSDTIKCCNLDFNPIIRRRIFFENFPLIIKKKKLIPIDEAQNKRFYSINGFDFPIMKFRKGKKNYKLYVSGYGPIH